jgi:hypothetical protein
LRLLLDPPGAHAQLTLSSQQPGGQRGATPEERVDETQEVTQKLADTCQSVPEAPEEVDDGIHAVLIARKASDGNMP